MSARLRSQQSGLEVVGSFYYLHEADLGRSLLESRGIDAWILDEHQIRQDWNLAAALGGVKLAVAPECAYRARQVLAEDHSLALDEIDEASLPAHPDERCPRCGSEATQAVERKRVPGPLQWATTLFFLLFALLVPRRKVEILRSCTACGHQWQRIEAR